MKKTLIVHAMIFAALCCIQSSCRKTTPPPGDPFASLNNQLVCKINGSEWRSNERGGDSFILQRQAEKKLDLVIEMVGRKLLYT
jgi:hypothetical protein